MKIVVPYPPGGTNDILGRITAERLQKALGQPFIVENRSGAGGTIGADFVAKSEPDGYTLLLSSSGPLAVALDLFKRVPYDVRKDFAPVAMIADVTVVAVSYPGFKPRTIGEVVAHAKANPGALRIAIPALGSMHHLLSELFRLRTGITVNMIPYKGTGPAIIDLMGGQVDIDFENLPAVIGHIRSSRLHPMAVASAKRTELLPDVPTLAELGYPELSASPWFALVAPAGTPKDVVARLNQAVNGFLQAPETKALLASRGANPVVQSPEQTGAFIEEEIKKWSKAVKESGAKLE
ncbi:MAG: Bug family tripartite tricarboxylate transporter substrate binding protein [Lautropia sp.]